MHEKAEYSVRQVPLDDSGRLDLLATRPPLWEYLLFGNALYLARATHQARWRDHVLGITLTVGDIVKPKDIPEMMQERLSYASAITGNLHRVLDETAQERAFGEPGDTGDEARIEHMATRVIDVYSTLLEWEERTRALRVPEWAERLKELLAAFVSQPLQRTHDFVDEFIASLESAIARLADGESGHEEIKIQITYEIGDDLIREFDEELDRIRRRL